MISHVKNPWWMSGFSWSPLPPEFGIDLLTTLALTEALLEALQQGLSRNHWLDRSGLVGTKSQGTQPMAYIPGNLCSILKKPMKQWLNPENGFMFHDL